MFLRFLYSNKSQSNQTVFILWSSDLVLRVPQISGVVHLFSPAKRRYLFLLGTRNPPLCSQVSFTKVSTWRTNHKIFCVFVTAYSQTIWNPSQGQVVGIKLNYIAVLQKVPETKPGLKNKLIVHSLGRAVNLTGFVFFQKAIICFEITLVSVSKSYMVLVKYA